MTFQPDDRQHLRCPKYKNDPSRLGLLEHAPMLKVVLLAEHLWATPRLYSRSSHIGRRGISLITRRASYADHTCDRLGFLHALSERSFFAELAAEFSWPC